jgi:S-DNA-T family DNA segregation ATPase FtsK/SpoIIIE
MSITIETAKLIDLINDLKHTTAPDVDSGAINGILLHTDRGYGFPGDPGRTDILVGTSTNRAALGHTYAQSYGQMTRPMLWPLQWALSVVNLFKPCIKDNKTHNVEISYDLDTNSVHVKGEADLFGEGTELSFAAGDLTKWPRRIWDILTYTEGQETRETRTPRLPRTDVSRTALAPFVAVAAAHGGVISMYRYHQNHAILLDIGDRYRGALIPTHWPDDKHPQAGISPGGDVYPAELPPEPDVTVDTDSRLQQAAELVVSTQFASPSMISRKLHVKPAEADTLLTELELIGIVSSTTGGRTRDVLVTPSELGKVLEKIRAREAEKGTEA